LGLNKEYAKEEALKDDREEYMFVYEKVDPLKDDWIKFLSSFANFLQMLITFSKSVGTLSDPGISNVSPDTPKS
jgi:hypothetical protein